MTLSLVKGTSFLFLTGLGTVGNVFVFVSYMYMFGGTEKKSIYIILMHVAFTNIVMLLSNGVPKTLSAFGLGNFLDDTSCKIVVYLGRVARGLSVCTSSLLTVVQAGTISPAHSRWRRLKPRSVWCVLHIFLLFWILNSLISMNLPFSIKNINSLNTSQIINSDKYCYFLPKSWNVRWTFLTLMVLRDAVFQALMGGASGYMVFVLRRHHQRVLHLQKSKFLCRTPPEIKAAQSVLLLMLCFLFFYWADCFISLHLTFCLEHDSITAHVPEFLTLGYALFSPFVLIHRDGYLAECWRAQKEREDIGKKSIYSFSE